MNEELNRKIAEWVGFYDTGHLVIDNWRTPDGKRSLAVRDLPDFTTSLDACEGYVFPKLLPEYAPIEMVIYPSNLYGYHVKIAKKYSADANALALALCKTVEKLIDGEEK